MEQRAFSRVSTFLRGRIRLRDSEDLTPRFYGFAVPESPVDQKALENAHIPAALVSFMLDMDTKLNAILGHLQQGRLQEDFPKRIEVCELGGAGLRMYDNGLVSPGDKVEIILFLSEFPLKVAGVMADVLRKEQDSHGRTIIAVEFANIREEDLEKIIQHVFLEERRQLRAQRLES